MEERPNHKRKVRAFGIMSRIFIPVGIVLTALNACLLTTGIVLVTLFAQPAIDSGGCVVSGASIHCNGSTPESLALGGGIAAASVGGTFLFFGLAFLIVGIVFKGVARRNRAADEANGVDYADTPYGK